ncbi:hypothetical protein MMYC01_206569 [Madurella mycetomatis]|uniref:Uncharacterized protein n=1 Tax=Madurella mycetomatis TaxID=100816 RepID=A0A175VWE0_9PEZI|nr:hypothetical protein MMYC01_206569 [Madurella mycetomatis]
MHEKHTHLIDCTTATPNLHPMETIVESTPETAKSGNSAEAMLFSAARPSQPNGAVGISTSTPAADVDHRSGRSSSLRLPPTRKASQRVREWVKRSNSARRVTQWLDFYPEASEGARSQSLPNQPSQAPPQSLPPNKPRQRHRSDSNGDLRPAPLRVPSLERQGGGGPHPEALARKNSKWKALPSLPGQQTDGTEQAVSLVSASHGRKAEAEREAQPQHRDGTTPLPVLRYGTPPPTPDSTVDGAARVLRTRDTKVTAPDVKSDLGTSVEEVPKRVESDRLVRHTGQERVWLHVNYRGEAPFLQAWGLDITKLSDRLEGLSILRDLMQAEKERKGPDAGGATG